MSAENMSQIHLTDNNPLNDNKPDSQSCSKLEPN